MKWELPRFKIPEWETIEEILGTEAVQLKHFSACKREEEHEDVWNRRISLWLRVSGALASFPSSAQASCITLAKVMKSLCATAPLLLHGFPPHHAASLSLSCVCLTHRDCELSEMQTASHLWFIFVLIQSFPIWIFFLLVLYLATSSGAYRWYHNTNKATAELLKGSSFKKINSEMFCFWWASSKF